MFDSQSYTADQERDANFYMRPHELALKRSRNGVASLPARVTRLNTAGAVAKVHLQTADGNEIQVDLSQDGFCDLDFLQGDELFVSAKNSRVFVPDYVI